jgi:predicted methyltransferase
MKMLRFVPVVMLVLAAPGCASKPAAPAPAVVATSPRTIVDAPDRTAEDRALDAGRHPAELLAFLDVKPGMRVAELAAAGGYTAELLARAVGPTGHVWAQNNKFILERFAEKPLSERMARPVMANVTRVDRDFESPLPDDANDLDLVVINLFYHDLYWFGAKRGEMNRAIWRHLKPGGRYVVIDHSAKPGSGAKDVQTLHRLEESTARNDIEQAGFKVVAESNFLRVPSDTMDWSTSPRTAGEKRGTSDRWALVFGKGK